MSNLYGHGEKFSGLCSAHQEPSPFCRLCNPVIARLALIEDQAQLLLNKTLKRPEMFAYDMHGLEGQVITIICILKGNDQVNNWKNYVISKWGQNGSQSGWASLYPGRTFEMVAQLLKDWVNGR